MVLKRFIFLQFFVFLAAVVLAQTTRLGVPYGQVTPITAVQFSPNGAYALTTTEAGTLNVWRNADGLLIYHIEYAGFSEGWKPSAAFHPRGSEMMVTTPDSTLVVYDIALGEKRYEIKAVEEIIHAEYSSDGNYILTEAGTTLELWSSADGAPVRTYPFSSYGRSTISPDMKYILVNGYTYMSRYDFETGALVSQAKIILDARLNADMTRVYSSTLNMGFMECRDMTTGDKLFKKFLGRRMITEIVFSEDNKTFAVLSLGDEVKIFNQLTGKKMREFKLKDWGNYAKLSPSGEQLVVAANAGWPRKTKLSFWDVTTGTLQHSIILGEITRSGDVVVTYSNDGSSLLAAMDKTAYLIDVAQGEIIHTFTSKLEEFDRVKYNDQLQLIAQVQEEAVYVTDMGTGELLHVISFEGEYKPELLDVWFDELAGEIIAVRSEGISRFDVKSFRNKGEGMNRGYLGVSSEGMFIRHGNGELILTDTSTGRGSGRAPQKIVFGGNGSLQGALLSPSGRYLVMALYEGKHLIRVFDLKELEEITWREGEFTLLDLSELNGLKLLADIDNGTWGSHVHVIDLLSNEPSVVLSSTSNELNQAKYHRSKPGYIVASGKSNLIYQYNLRDASGEGVNPYKVLTTDAIFITDLHWSDDRLIYLKNGSSLVRSFERNAFESLLFQDGNWLHLGPNGLFDASQGAMDQMYWLQGKEVIEFNQLKKNYWVPGLAEMIAEGKALPKANALGSVGLEPQVELKGIADGELEIYLKKRKGGYGKLSLFVNGKEVEEDIRPAGFNAALDEQTIYYTIKGLNSLTDSNSISVIAHSADESVQGRGVEVEYFDDEAALVKPHFYGVILGVGEYANSDINLNLTVPDAKAISTSIALGANELFGEDRTHIYTLHSETEIKPTKTAIRAVFQQIAQSAQAEDVVFLYMSGHGITSKGDSSDFYYLTADASSASAAHYTNWEVRSTQAISTLEFTEWLKEIPALKQVMVMDACGSGKAVENLSASRSIETSQIKVLDRMKDRTGMFIISGCAADAVSYEASRYGQGLLTYTLLQGMKGAALKNNIEVDVNTIFQFAKDEVPKLAADISGIQEPQLLIPRSGSVVIGLMDEESRTQVPLQEPKPVFVQSRLVDGDELFDVMGLSDLLDEQLMEMNSRGEQGSILFFNVKEYNSAYRVSGIYTQEGGVVKLKYSIKSDKHQFKGELTAADQAGIIDQLLQELKKVL